MTAAQLEALPAMPSGAVPYEVPMQLSGSSSAGDKPTGGDGAAAGGGEASGGSGNSPSSGGGDGKPPSGSGSGESSNQVAKAGVGEHAPKVPQVLALPLRRPVLPWFLSQFYTTDPAVIDALQKLRASRSPYVGLFLQRGADDGVNEVSMKPRTVDQLHQTGVLASLQSLSSTQDGGAVAWFLAHRRIQIQEEVPLGQLAEGAEAAEAGAGAEAAAQDAGAMVSVPPMVKVHHVDRVPAEDKTDMVRALSNEILTSLRSLVRLNPMFKEQMQYFTQRLEVHDAYRLADFAASAVTADPEDIQRVLEAPRLEERLEEALRMLHREEELAKLQTKIQQQVDEKMKETQRKYFLNEQLKSIKKELGLEKEDKDALIQKFRDRAAELNMPDTAKEVFEEEIDKLGVLERNSSEFNVTRSYLDWMTSIPWGRFSEDNFDIERAREVLDADHYGMKDVKERILEFIAVGKLRGSVQGKIMCLAGPPGVGKTSIGRSIARALDREFYRFSVGGLSDVAEIKGHRRTYVGAMPGKLIQCLKATKVSNPLVLIDEIDKIGSGGYRGDPSSALLEMLDPNQNGTFLDHYLDTPVDASKVLFLCTANVLDSIPGPLRDRMEVIDLSGYDGDEKVHIARNYLEPKIREEAGLGKEQPGVPESLGLDDSALANLIRWYCRESGVRNLEKHIEKVYRKVALKLVTEQEKLGAAAAAEGEKEEAAGGEEKAGAEGTAGAGAEAAAHHEPSPHVDADGSVDHPTHPAVVPDGDWSISADNLEEYVGQPRFTQDRMYPEPPVGVVMGLAYTSMGGSALYIEVATPDVVPAAAAGAGGEGEGDQKPKPGSGRLLLTGKMGEVMQESAQIARTYARRFAHLRKLTDNRLLDDGSLHLHVPEGATPKDGPSAGCTMVTALLSLAMDKPIRSDVAMTGEITLTGQVLPVGGIREKTMAAMRAGVSHIIVPAANRKDVDELPAHLKEGLTFTFAAKYDDVFEAAFDHGKPRRDIEDK